VTLDALIRMANQIAANQRHLPVDEAATRVADHLRLFWAPPMRDELLAHAASPEAGGPEAGGPDAGGPEAGGPEAGGPEAGGADLDPVVVAALTLLRTPSPQ
jgi:hypothetical protein